MKRSDEFRELLASVPKEKKWCREYIDGMYMLMCAYDVEEDERCVVVAREIIRNIDISGENANIIRNCYDTLARHGDFEAFMIAMEWNRPLEKQFYLPRARVFNKLGVVEAIQDLVDDKLDLLVINCPPRIGKTTLGMFLIVFMAGLYPERSILASGHSTALTQSFYKEFLNFVTSDEYRFSEIFPGASRELTFKSAEYCQADLGPTKRFHTVNFRSVDAGTTGLVEASGLLYLDDLVVDAEQANSKDRLDKLFSQYTSSLKDRKVQRLCKDGVYRPCPEIFIGTPWSLYDPMSRVIRDMEENGDKSRVRVVKMPCWNEDHESNFEYDYGKGFSVKYYEDMERVEDPVIFSAKYLCKPIEREGRPFEKDNLTYYTELPLDSEGNTMVPDRILAYNDVAHGGEDYMSMPIAFVYGMDVYIVDVLFIHNFNGDLYSRPLVCEMLMRNRVVSAGFEKPNGGDFYASLINQDLNRIGYRCNISPFPVPTNRSKLDRILSCRTEIQGINTAGMSYRILLKNPSILPPKSMYMEFLRNLWGWSQATGAIQKKQHDDAPDSLAGLIVNMLGKRGQGSVGIYDIRKAGY